MRRIPVYPVAIAAVSLLATGCGGGSATTTATTATENGPFAFARCMRSNGFANWPDPASSGVFDKSKLRQLGYDPARVRAAEDSACSHLLPANGSGPQETAQQTRTRLADALSFARCVRSHGVTNFPDPDAQGELSVRMVQAQGIDVHAPAVQRVVYACLPASHGALTRAKVQAAIREAGG